MLPGAVRGFETETEISVHALELAMPVGEVVTAYGARPEGSVSKLSTYRDGWRILKTILHLYRIERPVLFYGSFSLFLVALAVVLAIPLAITYFQTGLVPRFPTAILATGLMILAFLSFVLRPDPRHRRAGPARGPAALLSDFPGAGRRGETRDAASASLRHDLSGDCSRRYCSRVGTARS